MNTSKKHKGKNKSNKPPVGIQTDKSDVVESDKELPVSENAEKVTSVEEVQSKGIQEPLQENKETQPEKELEPKKPKRNKNKNKKPAAEGDTEQLIEIVKQSGDSGFQNVKNEKVQEMPSDEFTVAPSTRKKNKNKKPTEISNQPTELIKTDVLTPDVIGAIQKDSKNESSLIEIKEDQNEQEPKLQKKKNKKKKRHDSERSDKAEELISCTAAFQKLLDVKSDNIEANKDETALNDPTQTSKEVEKSFTENPPENLNIPAEIKTGDGVSKKKNKKNKNKVEVIDTKSLESEALEKNISQEATTILSEVEGAISGHDMCDVKVDGKTSENYIKDGNTSEKEIPTTPKSKAKIAKPVERKKEKSKSETKLESSETTVMAEANEPKSIPDKPLSLGDILYNPADVTEGKKLKEETKIDIRTSTDSSLASDKILEKLDDPKQKDKRAGKSPKVQENVTQATVQSVTKFGETELSKTIDTKLNIMSEEQSDDDNFVIPSLLDITEDEPQIPINTQIILEKLIEKEEAKQDIPTSIKEATVIPFEQVAEKPQVEDELQVPDTKHKKRKKSPKPLPRSKIETDNKTNLEDTDKDEIKVKATQVQQGVKTDDNVEFEPNTHQLDISKALPETTPDSIKYPRSLSHQISDSNNNTYVEEISSSEPVKSEKSVIHETTLIKGSGESPDEPPKLKMSDISITEVKTDTVKFSKEKTDLKSKVMEVNRDMEDLRLSIERSLAELTSMDNKEKEEEKMFEIKCSEEPKVEKVALAKNEPKKQVETPDEVPILPSPRNESKGKGKSKKKNKHENQPIISQETSSQITTQSQISSSQTSNQPSDSKTTTDNKTSVKSEKSEQKQEKTKGQTKQQSDGVESQKAANELNDRKDIENLNTTEKTKIEEQNSPTKPFNMDFEPIENFEDAMTSSLDDVNKTFEMIANESSKTDSSKNPQISVTAPEEDANKRDAKEKTNPVSQPKNLLGHPDIPVSSNRTDYKKEKNKPPNERQAKVKIKDSVEIEPKMKLSKESQTETKQKFLKKDATVEESVTCVTNENEEYVYKYSFRKVFLPNVCHICKKELKAERVPCNFCSLIFYCSDKHKDEGWTQHQALCFAVSTVAHHKGQKHIYADAKGLSGQNFRLFRMQLIVACEKVLKRRLVPWEQEALLYPRICANVNCREYRQAKLRDCEGCGQISYCTENPDHLPKSHQKWCKSYCLYQKLVQHQQTQGRLAPKMPTRVLGQETLMPDKINMVLASLYEEKIDMNDIQYAALTQIATAPLTVGYSYQLFNKIMGVERIDKSIFTIHIVNAELQYEADALNKWESLFLHLQPEVNELRLVLTGTELNPGGLPLDLLGKVKVCADCRLHSRRLIFSFQDKKTYTEYWDGNDFLTPDIVCAFNPSIQRSTINNGKDQWPITINAIFKLKCPFLVTSYTMNELNRDLNRIKECAKIEFKVISEAKFNPFASVRPDRNFITDDEIPLLFKNYCFAVLCGV